MQVRERFSAILIVDCTPCRTNANSLCYIFYWPECICEAGFAAKWIINSYHLHTLLKRDMDICKERIHLIGFDLRGVVVAKEI